MQANMNCFDRWKPVAAMLGANFALSIVNILYKKALNEGMSHLVIITYRQSIATVFLTPIAYFWERKSWDSLTGHIICALFFSALFGATLTQYFFIVGLKYTSATYTTAFINLVPVVTFIMALVFRLEKVNMRSKSGRTKVLGTLIGLGGALVLTLYKGMPVINASKSQAVTSQKVIHGAKDWALGTLFLSAASLVWSSWFLMQARIGIKFPFQYSSTAILSVFSAIQSAILSFSINRNMSKWNLKGPLEISTVIYAGIVGSGLGYVVMSWCVRERGPVFTSAFGPSIQIFVAFFDVSLLHEQINLGSILGSALVIGGMYILLWGKSKEIDSHRNDPAEGKDPDCNHSLPTTVPVAVNSRSTNEK